jgi:hypothetical protein
MQADGARAVGPWWAGRGVAVGIAAVAGFLLLSMGGAIVAAPVTVPLLALAARGRGRGRGCRTLAAVLAGLTLAEVGCAAAYLAVGEARPCVWLVPLLAGLGGGAAVWRSAEPPQN